MSSAVKFNDDLFNNFFLVMPQNASKIVFIDLDHTLLYNNDIRLVAARHALKVLFPEHKIEQALSTYWTIIEHTYAFEALGFPSFSHYWNPIEIYAILALLTADNEFIKNNSEALTIDKKNIWADLFDLDRAVRGENRARFFSDQDFYEAFLETSENKNRLKAFAQLARKILPDPLFLEAQRTYNRNLELKPLKDALGFLKRLKESEFLFYLVTEGLTRIQMEKVALLGLQDLFDGHILVTQAAAEPFEFGEIFKAAKALAVDRVQLFADEQRCLDYLTLSYFSSLIRRWTDKSNKQFYARVLHAVQINSFFPQQGLSHIEVLDRNEWLSRPPIKLAMIGDRYDKDLLPVLELCGKENSMTIRVQQGRYKDMPHPQQKATWRSPTISFEDFAQVEEIIFDPQKWEAIGPIPWPKIFDEPRSMQSAIYIEHAKSMAIPSVQKLARILENEQQSPRN